MRGVLQLAAWTQQPEVRGGGGGGGVFVCVAINCDGAAKTELADASIWRAVASRANITKKSQSPCRPAVARREAKRLFYF